MKPHSQCSVSGVLVNLHITNTISIQHKCLHNYTKWLHHPNFYTWGWFSLCLYNQSKDTILLQCKFWMSCELQCIAFSQCPLKPCRGTMYNQTQQICMQNEFVDILGELPSTYTSFYGLQTAYYPKTNYMHALYLLIYIGF